MIMIVAKNQVIPEKREEFMAIAEELIRASRMETGCIAYDLYENLEMKNELTFIEEWADMDAIEAHNASNHFTALVPKINECISTSDVQLYQKA